VSCPLNAVQSNKTANKNVAVFMYLGAAVTNPNYIHDKIKTILYFENT
jgi:hypothetical protein